MKIKLIYISVLLIFLPINSNSQDPLDELLGNIEANQENLVENTFKASRIMIGHSVEQPAQGEMEFRISHRFGRINGGGYELWGLDEATIHFSLEYSPMKRVAIGFGRSNYQKTYDGFVKASLFKQQNGKKKIPVSVSYLGSMELSTLRSEIENYKWFHRLNYTHQFMLARKFNKRFSFQVSPGISHKNLTDTTGMKNDILSLGLGGRYKITNRLSFNAEIFFVDHGPLPENLEYYNPLSFGIDLETGGHVFQILISNALPMREAGFITETTGNWLNGDIHLGFNISRMFNLYNPKN